jgi:hypothetical protein
MKQKGSGKMNKATGDKNRTNIHRGKIEPSVAA